MILNGCQIFAVNFYLEAQEKHNHKGSTNHDHKAHFNHELLKLSKVLYK